MARGLPSLRAGLPKPQQGFRTNCPRGLLLPPHPTPPLQSAPFIGKGGGATECPINPVLLEFCIGALPALITRRQGSFEPVDTRGEWVGRGAQ